MASMMGNTCGKWVGLLQELRDVCVALSLCSLKRRAPFAPLLMDVRLGGDRQLHNLVALLVCHEQRSGSITMRLVDIGVVVQEHLHNALWPCWAAMNSAVAPSFCFSEFIVKN